MHEPPHQQESQPRRSARGPTLKTGSLPVLALLALSAASWLPRVHGPLDLRWDAGVYYVLGTSLAEGKGYRLLNEPGEIEAVQYPPLLPVIVALHQRIIGTTDPVIVGRWLRLTFFLISTAFMLASYALLRQYLPLEYAFIAVLVCQLNLFVVFLSDLLFAELPFGLASVLFMLCNRRSSSRIHRVLAGVFAVAAYLLRSAGLAVLIAWVGESLFRRNFKQLAIRGVIALLPILGWQAYVARVQSGPSYEHPSYAYQRAPYMFYNVTYAANLSLRDASYPERGKALLGDVLDRVFRNLIQIPRSLGEAVSIDRKFWGTLVPSSVPGATYLASSRLAYVVQMLLGMLVLGGVAVQLARQQWVIALYIAAYVGAVSLTPWPEQWTRYWAPLAPFLVLALIQCLLAFRGLSRTSMWPAAGVVARFIPAGVLCTSLTMEAVVLLVTYRHSRGDVVFHDREGRAEHVALFYYDDSYRELDMGLTWLKARAQPGDVVAACMPQWAYLRTGLTAVMPTFENDPGKAQALLDSVPVKYIVTDRTPCQRTMQDSIVSVVDAVPPRWADVYAHDAGFVRIFQRISTATSGVTQRKGK